MRLPSQLDDGSICVALTPLQARDYPIPSGSRKPIQARAHLHAEAAARRVASIIRLVQAHGDEFGGTGLPNGAPKRPHEHGVQRLASCVVLCTTLQLVVPRIIALLCACVGIDGQKQHFQRRASRARCVEKLLGSNGLLGGPLGGPVGEGDAIKQECAQPATAEPANQTIERNGLMPL